VMQTDSNIRYAEVVAGLDRIGYHAPLVQEGYKFADWFSPNTEERQVDCAAFGQTPYSYESACIGVVRANGHSGVELVDRYRALGAPIFLEILQNEIREWAVSRNQNGHGLVASYQPARINEMFESRAPDWKPQSLLRAKNIGSFHWSPQLGLFAGLLPELEQHIEQKLDPLLHDAIVRTRDIYRVSTGRDANPAHLFRLVFWILTAKVFCDRRVHGFAATSGDADELLGLVARHYKTSVPTLLNRQTRELAASLIWPVMDFRNLSVEVLSNIWATTLVDEDTKRRLSIHRTPRTIVRYMVERLLPILFSAVDDKRIILEPCAGSSVFLIGAMNFLRQRLPGMGTTERHQYFVKHLLAVEKDPFAVEISRLALTLADFPNSNGWEIAEKDVFERGLLTSELRNAGVVLCNPPFGDFDQQERKLYRPHSVNKPAELLDIVLKDLHPEGVIGFVLPRNIIDGRGYSEIRQQLAKRFATIELTVLPDRAFEEADSEVVLLLASDPIPHSVCHVTNRRVNDNQNAWQQFERLHEVSSDHVADLGIVETSADLTVPTLPEVWEFLSGYPTLGQVAELHRGIEWNLPLTQHRSNLVLQRPAAGFMLGVPPRAKFRVFEAPPLRYLDIQPEHQRGNAWQFDWHKPKAIVNKNTVSRGAWRLTAFPDSRGITCYQNCTGVWPISGQFDEVLLSAVLNSPVANALVAIREGKINITIETLNLIPVPQFTEAQRIKLRELIREYQRLTSAMPLENVSEDAEALLKQIDATVLSGYRMPPRIERQLLDFFRNQVRSTKHRFSDYFPEDFAAYFSLSDYLSPDFASSTIGELLKRIREPRQV
jgi:hypothetical protein